MATTSLSIPALRGSFGSWIFYSCLMSLRDIAERVSYAYEIHPDQALSQLIQRSLEGARAKHIASYLEGTPDRFFNSLVFATYDGSPEWLELGNIRSTKRPELLDELSEKAKEAIGFLRLSGKEKIFAIDGQHRLAGIKRALASNQDLADEVVSVLLVGHKKTATGLQRTRRLFTTLNKTAKAVKKDDIIALDEDDVMAIIARRLVEGDARFQSPKIAVIASSNLPSTNRVALTTITNLYDVLKVIFEHENPSSRRDLRFNRPSDAALDSHYETAISYFTALASAFPPVGALMKAKNPAKISTKNRGPHGGHLLFRPIGLEVFTRVVVAYAKKHDVALEEAVGKLRSIPTDITKAPYEGVLWDGRLISKRKPLLRRLISHMAGLESDTGKLLADYREALGAGSGAVKLPKRIV